jgi:two-component system C4-dicarboxylate transport response regulator DctD
MPLPERLDRYEAEIIRETLGRNDGDVRRTIEALGIPRKTFYDKLQRHGIVRSDFSR